jgi:hypothetical protein
MKATQRPGKPSNAGTLADTRASGPGQNGHQKHTAGKLGRQPELGSLEELTQQTNSKSHTMHLRSEDRDPG